jgi:GntR family transcriptional regulator/MocR family aminotransferase
MPKRSASPELPLAAETRGKFAALYRALRQAIAEDRLSAGARLPSSRDLATQQGVARGTVVAVFEQLTADGFLESRAGAGTFVRSALSHHCRRRPTTMGALAVKPVVASPFIDHRQAPRPFRTNVPAADLFPRAAWARIAGRHWRRALLDTLADEDPRGQPALRSVLAEHLATTRGVRCSVDNVVITPSSQASLDLIARVALSPKDAVWVEDPGYVGARALLRQARATIIPIPVDAQGMDIDAAASGKRPRLIHVTPAHQSPLGVTLSLPRRQAVLERAKRANALVFEDDYDGEFRFGTRPLGALQSMDSDGRVVHAGSFSKTLLPSLRLAYMVVPDSLIDAVTALLSLTLRFVSPHDQAVLAAFISEGHFARHIRRLRDAYGARHAMLRSECERLLGGIVSFDAPAAGLDGVAWLPQHWSDAHVARRLAAESIEARPLSQYRLTRGGSPGLVLGVAAFDEPSIRLAVARMAGTLTQIAFEDRHSGAAGP